MILEEQKRPVAIGGGVRARTRTKQDVAIKVRWNRARIRRTGRTLQLARPDVSGCCSRDRAVDFVSYNTPIRVSDTGGRGGARRRLAAISIDCDTGRRTEVKHYAVRTVSSRSAHPRS